MPKICYVRKKFKRQSVMLIDTANEIIADYAAQGYSLTLRQLYYQFVSKDIIPNNQKEYDKLGKVISDARRAGLIDWYAIVDRTRSLRALGHWDDPGDIIKSSAESYAIDKWADQPYRIEVWIEKDALAGVFERVCNEMDIALMSCRGYTSDSSIWEAGMRLRSYSRKGQTPLILHFGDHDPSGMDMTRDITERLAMFSELDIDVSRLALNMDQVEEYEPPPNPAKTTDSRYAEYIRVYGDESWELDALEPSVLSALVTDELLKYRDEKKWKKAVAQERKDISLLEAASENWDNVADHIISEGYL